MNPKRKPLSGVEDPHYRSWGSGRMVNDFSRAEFVPSNEYFEGRPTTFELVITLPQQYRFQNHDTIISIRNLIKGSFPETPLQLEL